MAETGKKQNFLQGAALLAFATAIVKIIGAVYKIPLRSIIGDVGYSYFNTAYDIYTLLMLITTAGLPVAMSRLISQAYSLGEYNRVRQVYRTARVIYLSLGIVCTLLMMGFCQILADKMVQPDAWIAILCLAPCATLMGFLSTYRGFFQGQGNMAPTSASQILEAVCKLIVGLTAALLCMYLWGSVSLAAGGAILGVTVSCLVSAIYLNARFRPAYRELPVSAEQVESFQKTSKKLLSIAVPITIGAAGLQLLNVLEIGIYMERIETILSTGQYDNAAIPALQEEVMASADYTGENLYSLIASSLKGIYNFGQTIFNLPCAFIITINTSVLPAVTALLTRNEHDSVRSTEESASRITGLLSLPCAVGLFVLAGPIMGLLGGYEGERLVIAEQLMALLGVAVFFYSVVMFTNVLLQAHGYAHVPVIHMLLCGALKLAAVYILSGNPQIGILGVPIGAILCYLCIAVLNLFALWRLVPQKPKLVRNLMRPLLPSALMGAAVYGCLYLLKNVLTVQSNLILCGVPLVLGVLVYFISMILLKTVTREDCLLLPKGEKIAKVLKL